ncbi:MAG: lysophospholipase [Candidatus Omnitrophica bacterium]|nr:lysophospholipase [Candidatus Omnitrophota bacterium]
MKCSEDYFYTIDGLRLYYQHCVPDAGLSPKVVLIVVHGLGEHSHRYRQVMDAMAGRQMGAAAFDLRGHGRSEGRRGHIRSFRDYLQDLRQFIQLCKALHPQPCQFFLTGHSLGGLIALAYCLEKAESLNGVIVSGPALGVKLQVPGYKKFLASLLSAFLPSVHFQNEVHPHLLSRDPAVVEGYLSDPLVHHEVTARFYTETVKTMAEVQRNIPLLRLPVLFLQGENDHIVDPRAVQHAFQTIVFKDKTLYTYPGNLHEVFNDLDKERVFEDLYRWIQRHASSCAKT